MQRYARRNCLAPNQLPLGGLHVPAYVLTCKRMVAHPSVRSGLGAGSGPMPFSTTVCSQELPALLAGGCLMRLLHRSHLGPRCRHGSFIQCLLLRCLGPASSRVSSAASTRVKCPRCSGLNGVTRRCSTRSFEARSAPLACSRCLKLFELEVELVIRAVTADIEHSPAHSRLESAPKPRYARPDPGQIRGQRVVRRGNQVSLTDPEF